MSITTLKSEVSEAMPQKALQEQLFKEHVISDNYNYPLTTTIITHC